MESQSREPPGSGNLSRIIFIEMLDGIGDAMIALPSMQALARSNPRSELDVMISAVCAPLLQDDPLVARTHVVSGGKSADEGNEPVGPEDVERVLSSASYDLVVLDGSNEEIARTVENCVGGTRVINLRRDPLPDRLVEERFLEILAREHLIDPHCVSLVARIALSQQETKWARCWRGNNLQERHPAVILDPNATATVDAWAAQSFITVGRWLASRHHCNVVVLSGDEPDLACTIACEIGKGATILAKCGLRDLGAIASLCSLFVSTDPGLARVAAAAGSRAIVLFGRAWAGMYGLRPPHVNIRSPRVCAERDCSGFVEPERGCSGKCVVEAQGPCLNDIAPEVVMRAAERMLHP